VQELAAEGFQEVLSASVGPIAGGRSGEEKGGPKGRKEKAISYEASSAPPQVISVDVLELEKGEKIVIPVLPFLHEYRQGMPVLELG